MNLSKLCRKDIEKYCAFCKHSNGTIDEQQLVCRYYGLVERTGLCKKYQYSPLKRTPPKRVKIKHNFNLEDL